MRHTVREIESAAVKIAPFGMFAVKHCEIAITAAIHHFQISVAIDNFAVCEKLTLLLRKLVSCTVAFREFHPPRIISIRVPRFSEMLQNIVRQYALMCAVDNTQKVSYTYFSSLDRVNTLGLCVRLAAIFLPPADRMSDIVRFQTGNISTSLLNCNNGHKLSVSAVVRISRHSVCAHHVFCLVVQRVHRNCILNHITNHSTKSGIRYQTVYPAVQTMPNAGRVNAELSTCIRILDIDFPIALAANAASIFHAFSDNNSGIHLPACVSDHRYFRKSRNAHIRQRSQKTIIIDFAILSQVFIFIRLTRLLLHTAIPGVVFFCSLHLRRVHQRIVPELLQLHHAVEHGSGLVVRRVVALERSA